MIVRGILKWIDRDLDHSAPWSLLLIIVPFLPFGIALGLGAKEQTSDAILGIGIVLATPWFLYAFVWRALKRFSRSISKTKAYFNKRRDGLD